MFLIIANDVASTPLLCKAANVRMTSVTPFERDNSSVIYMIIIKIVAESLI